jgi:hypothetical protein
MRVSTEQERPTEPCGGWTRSVASAGVSVTTERDPPDFLLGTLNLHHNSFGPAGTGMP